MSAVTTVDNDIQIRLTGLDAVGDKVTVTKPSAVLADPTLANVTIGSDGLITITAQHEGKTTVTLGDEANPAAKTISTDIEFDAGVETSLSAEVTMVSCATGTSSATVPTTPNGSTGATEATPPVAPPVTDTVPTISDTPNPPGVPETGAPATAPTTVPDGFTGSSGAGTTNTSGGGTVSGNPSESPSQAPSGGAQQSAPAVNGPVA